MTSDSSSTPAPGGPIPQLEQWCANGWLIRKTPTRSEVRALFKVADRELRDTRSPSLSTDGQFVHGYQAALAAAHAALVAAGYAAAKGESHHVRIIESLQFTLGCSADTVTFLGRMRRKRNEGLYTHVGVVSEVETEE